MNKLRPLHIFLLLFLAAFLVVSCSRLSAKSASRKAERQMAGPKRSARKMKELPEVRRAIKASEKRQAKINRDKDNYIKQSRKRSYDIQSESVKARMKQNEINIDVREKEKDKRIKVQSKGRAKKFR